MITNKFLQAAVDDSKRHIASPKIMRLAQTGFDTQSGDLATVFRHHVKLLEETMSKPLAYASALINLHTKTIQRALQQNGHDSQYIIAPREFAKSNPGLISLDIPAGDAEKAMLMTLKGMIMLQYVTFLDMKKEPQYEQIAAHLLEAISIAVHHQKISQYLEDGMEEVAGRIEEQYPRPLKIGPPDTFDLAA